VQQSIIDAENYHSPIIVESNRLIVGDHLGDFDSKFFSPILDLAVDIARKKNIKIIDTAYFFDKRISALYPDIDFCYKQSLVGGMGWESLTEYHIHPEPNFKTFLCSFNGSPHVSRKLLSSILKKFGWFNPKTCSKNFTCSVDAVDGHIRDYVPDLHHYYRKFFISDQHEQFLSSVYTFGHVRFDHKRNIYNLESKITKSFLHIVSETIATSYYPFVTEKFLYSVVTRGLFLAYAQPGWHDHLERYYGFRKYNRIFDYRFDTIQNPIERLVELMSMISKFSVLSSDDWRDLYEMEIDTIEYNYDWYFSKKYLKQLEQFS
jgi:hypothetical protein